MSHQIERLGARQPGSSSSNNKKQPSFVQKLFKDFNWTKFGTAVMLAAAGGAAYSVIDQTMIHRPKPGSKLPCVTDFLVTTAPDILEALDRFYQYRNTVPDQRSKTEFCRLAGKVVVQSEYIAAIYQQLQQTRDLVTPEMEALDLCNQMRAHVAVAIECMRKMLALVQRPGDVDLEDAFNQLYSTFNNRVYLTEQWLKE